MGMASKDRLTKLEERRVQLDAQIADAKARLKERDRAIDTRRKIMAGANALEIAAEDPDFLAKLAAWMNRTIKRPQDRHSITPGKNSGVFTLAQYASG
jgi:septal ring factor EnvC (AmiA/AmiB activator)